jgi:hypothetical protein
MDYACLICHEVFQTKSNFKCLNDQCNVFICVLCIQTWDKMYEKLECPVCHTSREKPDIENQTQEIRVQERITDNNTSEIRTIRRSVRENQIYPLQTIGMSSRGRMLFIISSRSIEEPSFIDRYCDYMLNENIQCLWKCCKTLHCILFGLFITIIIGFMWVNLLYLIEEDDSIKDIWNWNETKENYQRPDYYLILSINGICVISFIFIMIGCCYRCYEKCK